MTPTSPDVEVRPVEDGDRTAVLALLASAMGRPADERFAWLHEWKHERNPFGPSLAWVALDRGEVVGYRAFLRWEFLEGTRRYRAVRAVDTATDPDHQGLGIFRTLTMHGLEACRAAQIDFVFNTPNDQSRPGYYKMGWERLGGLRPRVRPRSPLALPAMLRGRVPAGHWGEPTDVGLPASTAFADDANTARLLASSHDRDDLLRTARSPAYLRWRYDARLGYRVLLLGPDLAEGAACFRLRRRGAAVEATVCELLVPPSRSAGRARLVRRVLAATGADYALVVGGSWRDRTVAVPGEGPTVTWRAVCEHRPTPLDRWSLSMGDIELF